MNADEIETVGERHPAKQADLFEAAHARFMELAQQHQGNDTFTWFDTTMEWAEATGI